ncbi:MAG: ABC transporter ATP-binding protein [Pseudomonadota bacterium]
MQSIRKAYELGDHTVVALDAVNLHIDTNEYVAFVGSSGSGKSTIMNIIGCLDRPSAGRYVLNGHDVSELGEDELARIRNEEIGFIFQSFNLLARASALRNVMQPLIYRGMPIARRRALAISALERVGLGDRVEHMPNQLSGGQRQRVAIARALVTSPSLLLADEPTGNLDSESTRNIMALFDELHDEGQTLIVVTHEADIATHCHRVIELSDGRVASDARSHVRAD